jgi:predicted ATP-grasp superfamily ATP-dependent carboligase
MTILSTVYPHPPFMKNEDSIAVGRNFERTRLKSPNVLILDGAHRSALAATRSLGEKGIHVVVGGEQVTTLAGRSRYCSERLTYPSPARNPKQFIQVILEEIRRREIEVLLPMTEITTSLVLQERARFHEVRIPFASFELFNRLADKWQVMELARNLGIAIPATHFVKNRDDLERVCREIDFPAVLKPFRSRIWCENRWFESSVTYANSPQELRNAVRSHHCFAHHPFLVQQLIRGQGYGVFTLYDQGKPTVFFAHRRLREKPPSGGVSVLSESVEMNPLAFRAAKTILDHVGWHGVVMVEFKVADDGTPYLMEINPRFWGSLQLAIDAGVDFPWLAFEMAVGEPPFAGGAYRVGVKERWLLGDIAHLYRLFFPNGNRLRLSRDEKWRSIKSFLKFFNPNMRYEINRWDDLGPFFFELKHLFAKR